MTRTIDTEQPVETISITAAMKQSGRSKDWLMGHILLGDLYAEKTPSGRYRVGAMSLAILDERELKIEISVLECLARIADDTDAPGGARVQAVKFMTELTRREEAHGMTGEEIEEAIAKLEGIAAERRPEHDPTLFN